MAMERVQIEACLEAISAYFPPGNCLLVLVVVPGDPVGPVLLTHGPVTAAVRARARDGLTVACAHLEAHARRQQEDADAL